MEEGFGKNNAQVVDQHVDSNLKSHDPSNPQDIRGSEGLKQFISQLHRAFPDLKYKVEGLSAEEDTVTCRWSVSGTHRGEMFNQPASGKRINITGTDVLRFSNGKVVEVWACWDALGFYQQIGAIPEMESADSPYNR